MARYEYTVIPITGQNGRAAKFVAQTTDALNAMAADGWRLIAVDTFWAFLEREVPND